MMNCTLDEILEYEHLGVVDRFKRDFPEKEDKAEDIFKDMLRFFWASEKHDQDQKLSPDNQELKFSFIMDEEMKPIDEIWHIFLLYTKDYMDFCDKYFKQYIHHLPDIVPNMPQNEQAFEDNLNRFLSYSYDNLGEETVRRWFGEDAA